MPEDVTEYHGKVFVDDKTFNDEALLLVDEQRNWFLEMASTPYENAVKTVKMTAKHLEYYTNFIDKELAGF